MIDARIICDSMYNNGVRLTTFQLRYPRWIHSEVMTHRMFSRSASSSRAVPVRKILSSILCDPARPVHWGRNMAGMQAHEELTGWRRWMAERIFMGARYPMVAAAWALNKLGLHKQLVNRIVEPWSHITVLITSTEWDNFFNLRCHPNAQPEIRELAQQMRSLHKQMEPRRIFSHEWHLPYITTEEFDRIYYTDNRCPDFELSGMLWWRDAIRYSVARCARISYANHGTNKVSASKDRQLTDSLLRSGHMGPFEHQAKPGDPEKWYGNFRGWQQYRKTIPGEAVFARGR